jgi:hypothetical protein
VRDLADQLAQLDAVHDVDLSIGRGILRSTKTAFAYCDGHYGIFHSVDGRVVRFTRDGIREVLAGTRDPWDGDMRSHCATRG